MIKIFFYSHFLVLVATFVGCRVAFDICSYKTVHFESCKLFNYIQ